jgi:hypothetical protein
MTALRPSAIREAASPRGDDVGEGGSWRGARKCRRIEIFFSRRTVGRTDDRGPTCTPANQLPRYHQSFMSRQSALLRSIYGYVLPTLRGPGSSYRARNSLLTCPNATQCLGWLSCGRGVYIALAQTSLPVFYALYTTSFSASGRRPSRHPIPRRLLGLAAAHKSQQGARRTTRANFLVARAQRRRKRISQPTGSARGRTRRRRRRRGLPARHHRRAPVALLRVGHLAQPAAGATHAADRRQELVAAAGALRERWRSRWSVPPRRRRRRRRWTAATWWWGRRRRRRWAARCWRR